MIDMLLAASASIAQPPVSATPPSYDIFVCRPQSTDPRCRRASTATSPLPPTCPDGSRVPEGQQCPVQALPPAIVYFGYDSTALDEQARATLDGVASNYGRAGRVLVALAGHTDRSGSASYNQRLSERYANAVRDYLVGAGVSASAITVQGFGETRPAIDTPDGVREPQNRRVEITFGPLPDD